MRRRRGEKRRRRRRGPRRARAPTSLRAGLGKGRALASAAQIAAREGARPAHAGVKPNREEGRKGRPPAPPPHGRFRQSEARAGAESAGAAPADEVIASRGAGAEAGVRHMRGGGGGGGRGAGCLPASLPALRELPLRQGGDEEKQEAAPLCLWLLRQDFAAARFSVAPARLSGSRPLPSAAEVLGLWCQNAASVNGRQDLGPGSPARLGLPQQRQGP